MCWLAHIQGGLLLLVVFEPINVMVQHGRCLRCLRFICDILFGCPQDALRHLPALESIIDEHHTLWLELYGSDLATPKLHWLWHVVEQIRKSGCLNCFKPERDHRKIHEAGVHMKSKGPSYEAYCLKRILLNLLQGLSNMSFRTEHILGSHINKKYNKYK